ncbi:MAG: hypothetical protein MUE85_09680 [Microscillaceae bacterium]|jgi:hypothetical protein|nr:hypothetical protein [Microscillaceae bacterium]
MYGLNVSYIEANEAGFVDNQNIYNGQDIEIKQFYKPSIQLGTGSYTNVYKCSVQKSVYTFFNYVYCHKNLGIVGLESLEGELFYLTN